MTNNEKKILQQAIKILRQDWPKKTRCATYTFQCPGCNIHRLIGDLDSFVNFYASTEEEMKVFWERIGKRKKNKK